MLLSKIRHKLTSTQILACGFAVIILFGGILLSLPISSKERVWTPFLDSLFTATSATCVTGLVVFDTFTYWSLFGQIVILCMIQIGGIGFMTVISLIAVFMKKRIGLQERQLLMQSAGSMQIGGIVRLVKRIALGTLLFEGAGAIALSFRFCPEMGAAEGLYNAVFHSISAFCNAGFDLMGKKGAFSSLTTDADDPLVNITIMLLIVIGGLGFIVWDDIYTCRFRFRRFTAHSKMVLMMTGSLILAGAVSLFFLEGGHSFREMPLGERVLASFFQSVTARTAGYNTSDLTQLSESGSLVISILMMIGGSPGSTAGGIKTTTIFVLLLDTIASSRRMTHINAFKRRINSETVKQASAVITVYLTAALAAVILICAWEPYTIRQILFEVASAIGTVGLSMGITPTLSPLSHVLLMLLMFGGRIGGLSLVMTIAEKKEPVPVERPVEKIIIG